jgi:hypothetical protein
MPLVLKNLDEEQDVPFADESSVATPVSDESGAILAAPASPMPHSRHSSYTSHSSRISYTSHGDVFGARGGTAGPPLSWAIDKRSGCFNEVRTPAPVSFLTSFRFFLSFRFVRCSPSHRPDCTIRSASPNLIPSSFPDQSALTHTKTILSFEQQDLILDPEEYMMAMKHRSLDNPFLDNRRPSNKQTLVDMRGNLW